MLSLKIKTGDGSLIICQMSDVTKITKEERYTRGYRKDTNDRKAARNTLKGYKGFRRLCIYWRCERLQCL